MLVSAVAEAAGRFVAAHDPEFINTYRWAASLAETYPGDPGVVISLMCNHLKLAPGEAVFLPAGNLHAYLSGAGVEVMASSDNVLRGGLTGKHVDLAALIEVLDFTDGRVPVLHPVLGPGGLRYPVPVEDFDLTRCQLDAQAGTLTTRGPAGAAVHRGHGRAGLGRRRAGPGEGRLGVRAGRRPGDRPRARRPLPGHDQPRLTHAPGARLRGDPSHSVRPGLRNGAVSTYPGRRHEPRRSLGMLALRRPRESRPSHRALAQPGRAAPWSDMTASTGTRTTP